MSGLNFTTTKQKIQTDRTYHIDWLGGGYDDDDACALVRACVEVPSYRNNPPKYIAMKCHNPKGRYTGVRIHQQDTYLKTS